LVTIKWPLPALARPDAFKNQQHDPLGRCTACQGFVAPVPCCTTIVTGSSIHKPILFFWSLCVQDNDDKSAFDSAIRALEFEIANAGTHLTIDATARQAYSMQIQAMANELRGQATSGRITWAQAAQQAQETRNVIMEVI